MATGKAARKSWPSARNSSTASRTTDASRQRSPMVVVSRFRLNSQIAKRRYGRSYRGSSRRESLFVKQGIGFEIPVIKAAPVFPSLQGLADNKQRGGNHVADFIPCWAMDRAVLLIKRTLELKKVLLGFGQRFVIPNDSCRTAHE